MLLLLLLQLLGLQLYSISSKYRVPCIKVSAKFTMLRRHASFLVNKEFKTDIWVKWIVTIHVHTILFVLLLVYSHNYCDCAGPWAHLSIFSSPRLIKNLLTAPLRLLCQTKFSKVLTVFCAAFCESPPFRFQMSSRILSNSFELEFLPVFVANFQASDYLYWYMMWNLQQQQ